MAKLLLLNGPNLNRLGKREPEVYGSETLDDIEHNVREVVEAVQYQLDAKQSNHEGELIDWIHEAEGVYKGIIFNPGAYTHTSIALRDAISSITVPVIEVHISNVHQREEFRHTSLLAPVCRGQIVGLGTAGYQLAAKYFTLND
ncbi:type II 3-dehydroquinate dehydratase [Gracilibacillus sp. S3-1-1]|uniref:Type II 3-dehydroquinate dehydratase n=1 Tax=Gracilibacillus pellucidus TaxID=3095368 RepID=A0ACC6M5A7_9BACI|nr:type II 3-dehydroquinate dehydratase [Gracilibacillus sp. S3-1-1]MDX8046012.1 type II 3-dehydroquinate dehydratase [Gracilibacillus sp. S3-1-1]